MSLLSKLFGGGQSSPKPKAEVEPENYNGFLIYPEPQSAEGGFRVAARIEKEINGELKTHHLVRADVSNNEDDAKQISVNKAKVFIDQMGDGVFR